jgi:hypothetical protein
MIIPQHVVLQVPIWAISSCGAVLTPPTCRLGHPRYYLPAGQDPMHYMPAYRLSLVLYYLSASQAIRGTRTTCLQTWSQQVLSAYRLGHPRY